MKSANSKNAGRGLHHLTRRSVLAGSAAFAAGLSRVARAAAQSSADAQAARSRPNVLFLCIDDLNDWIGALGVYPGVRTPFLDAFAQRSALFSRAYTASPACNPSRTAVLTGYMPNRTGVLLNLQDWRKIVPNILTLPEHFQKNGYTIASAGKVFHFGQDITLWDAQLPQPGDPVGSNFPKKPDIDQMLIWGGLNVPEGEMGDVKVASWVEQYLAQPHDRPFFLGVGLFRPHLPWYIPQRYYDMYPLDSIALPPEPPGKLNLPPGIKELVIPSDGGLRLGDHPRMIREGKWREAVQAYLASITFADEQFGRIMAALARSAFADNTIVVVWSDNGFALGQKEVWRKFTLWTESAHVPLIVNAPGVTTPGSRINSPVSLIDLFPTLTDLCALPPGPSDDGASLRPLLADPSRPWDRPAFTVYAQNMSIRTKQWTMIRYANGDRELYDCEADPLEFRNLARSGKYSGLMENLERQLNALKHRPSVKA